MGATRPRRVLGVDVGLADLGLGVVEDLDRSYRAVATRQVSTPSKMPLDERIRTVSRALATILADHDVDRVAVELYAPYARSKWSSSASLSAFQVGAASAAVVGAIGQRPIVWIKTAAWWEALRIPWGSGRTDEERKRVSGHYVRAIVRGLREGATDHELDACGVAVAGFGWRRA